MGKSKSARQLQQQGQPAMRVHDAEELSASSKAAGRCIDWMASNQLLVWGVVAVVVAAGIAQFVAMASGGSLFSSGGVHNLDLAGEDAIVDAMTSGQPWVVFCDEDATRAGQTSYQRARAAFAEAATLLGGKVSAGQLDCSRKMPRSGKSVYTYAGISGRGRMPATVLVAANGARPRAAIPSIVTNAKRLAKFAAEHSALKTVDLGQKRGVAKCLAARTCVVIAHSGAKGRRPVKAVVTDMMAAHRTAQFATLDTSKTWLGGLPGSLVAALPRAARAQAANVSRRVKVTGGKSRNVVVSGWGSANAAEDAMGQVVFVLRRDPRRPPATATSSGPRRGNAGSGAAAGSAGARGPGPALVATWRSATDASGGGHGRMLVSRGDINAAIRAADEAAERARAKGRRLSATSVKPLVAEVMAPHEGQDSVGVALKRRVVALAPPPTPAASKRPQAAPAAGASASDPRVAQAAARRAEREARRAASRAQAEGGADSAAGAADREPSAEEQRAAELAARQAMEAEAQQWIAQPADEEEEGEDEDAAFEMEGYEDGDYEDEEDEEGFVEL